MCYKIKKKIVKFNNILKNQLPLFILRYYFIYLSTITKKKTFSYNLSQKRLFVIPIDYKLCLKLIRMEFELRCI